MREAVGRIHELRKLEESFADVRVEDKGLRAVDEAVDVAVKRLKTVGPALEALQVRICARGVWLMSWRVCGVVKSVILRLPRRVRSLLVLLGMRGPPCGLRRLWHTLGSILDYSTSLR